MGVLFFKRAWLHFGQKFTTGGLIKNQSSVVSLLQKGLIGIFILSIVTMLVSIIAKIGNESNCSGTEYGIF